MEQKILLEDHSGDKDCFTIIPNYILNHSSAIDQALYLQMKRLAGDGKKDYCYPSFNYLGKQLHIGKKAIKKSIEYLVGHEWIENLGKRQVHTAGGIQWVNAYRINNIWKLNNNNYKGGVESDPLHKGGVESAKGGFKRTQGGFGSSAIRRTYKELKKKEHSSFKKLKPFYKPTGEEMRFAQNKKWVLPRDGGDWLLFAGKESDIEYR